MDHCYATDLAETLNRLPPDYSVTINKVGNLAVLNQLQDYVGWIDMRDGSIHYLSEEK